MSSGTRLFGPNFVSVTTHLELVKTADVETEDDKAMLL